jgi:sugar/nucleoside kinase (ribokinase family)
MQVVRSIQDAIKMARGRNLLPLVRFLASVTRFVMILPAMSVFPARKRQRLAVLGEFFLDLVFYDLPTTPRMGEEVKTDHFAESPGGGLATTALVAAGLGTATAVITRVGHDASQHAAWQRLAGSRISRISAAACEYSSRFPTAMTVCAAHDGDRMMITYDAINKELHTLLTRGAVRREILRASHLHLACAMHPLERWTREIRKLRARGITLSTDIGWNTPVLESPKLPALLRECNFVFPNEMEARAMTGENAVEKAAMTLARWVRVPVVKLGEEGSIAVHRGKLLRVRSLRVRSVDATGAGDAFNGGFLHGHLSGWPIEDCLRAGNVCGALATTAAGGSSAIPSKRKLLELMRKI